MEKIEETSFENNTNEFETNSSQNDDYENNLAIFQDIILPYKKYQDIIISLNKIITIIPTLKYDKQKDMDKIEKKFLQFFNISREMNNNIINFFNKSIIDTKKNIKLEKKKKKENKDKSKYYVNIPKNAPKFILAMMNKDENDKVSQSQVLTALIQMIKKCTESSPTNYAVFKDDGKINKTKFMIYGELKTFFDNIKNEAMNRGNEIEIPNVMGYPNLMSYMQYFVYKNKE